MASLDDILNAWKKVEADVAAGNYLTAYEDTIPAQQAIIDFGKSIGFKAGPNDAKTRDEIEQTAQKCLDACKADKKKAAGAFDWKGLLSQMLTAFLQWWITRPTPPAPNTVRSSRGLRDSTS